MITPARLPKRMPTTFAKLVALHAPRPIADDEALADATEVLDRLAVINGPTADQADYLHTLTLLVAEYEDEHEPDDRPLAGGVSRLNYLLDANGMTAADLGRLLGVVRSAASMILAGQRAITVDHARKLGRRFAIDPAAFLDL